MNVKAQKKTTASAPKVEPLFDDYAPIPGTYDELFDEKGKPRAGVASVARLFDAVGKTAFKARCKLADAAMLHGGTTFTVYGEKTGVERVFPFDPIPRLVARRDWEQLSTGLTQRTRALNMFLADVYGDQRMLKENDLLRDVVMSSPGYDEKVHGIKPPGGVHVQIAGIDLVRAPDGAFLVLEDNLRCPSGVSYVLESRSVMKRVLPKVFTNSKVQSVEAYPTRLLETLLSTAPVPAEEARLVLLSPGPFNSAYFEHSFLARRMGCDLVVPSDLFVDDDKVYVKTTEGPLPVHVIYRRIDDEFIDPEVFRKDSLLGVPGLVGAYRKGNVTLANALGNGVADDKGVYPFVPDMVRFYLSEEPLLGQVTTLQCAIEEDRKRVLANPGGFVIKSVDASGGYGLLIGPKAKKRDIAEMADKIRAAPRGYIAQPLIELSTCPTWTGNAVEPRRVDLRPYILSGKNTWVLPGGLTRVALRKGSYVVNSSQGGGSKDTWIMEDS